jgi:hypothetical protein
MNNFGFDIDEAIDIVKEKEEMMDYTDVEIKPNNEKNKNVSEQNNKSSNIASSELSKSVGNTN